MGEKMTELPLLRPIFYFECWLSNIKNQKKLSPKITKPTKMGEKHYEIWGVSWL